MKEAPVAVNTVAVGTHLGGVNGFGGEAGTVEFILSVIRTESSWNRVDNPLVMKTYTDYFENVHIKEYWFVLHSKII